MKHRMISVLLAVAIALGAWGVMPALAISTTVAIGEIQSRGSAGAGDEYVEIYNLSTSSIPLANYRIQYRSCTGSAPTTYYTFPAVNLQAYGHYLIAGTAYNGSTTPDGSLSSGMSDCGQVQLQDSTGAAVDTVVYTWSGGTTPSGGWVGIESTYFGNNPHNNSTGTNQDTSFARQPDTVSTSGGHINNIDTDNNSTDFLSTTTSSPENMSGPTLITLTNVTAQSNARISWGALGVTLAALAVGGGVALKRRRQP